MMSFIRIHNAIIVLFAIYLAACFSIWSACSDDDESSSERWAPADDDDDNDDTEDGSSEHCLEILEYLYFDCGAQFYDEYGNPISFSAMGSNCDAIIVECIVSCGDESDDCSVIQLCLEDSCELI